jgi:hypothetical protein
MQKQLMETEYKGSTGWADANKANFPILCEINLSVSS